MLLPQMIAYMASGEQALSGFVLFPSTYWAFLRRTKNRYYLFDGETFHGHHATLGLADLGAKEFVAKPLSPASDATHPHDHRAQVLSGAAFLNFAENSAHFCHRTRPEFTC